MAVRNFWLQTDIDGRVTQLHGGPQAKDGGFTQNIYVRDEGASKKAYSVHGIATEDGRLRIVIFDGKETLLHTSTTKR